MDLGIEGKVALVTASSDGLGLAAAATLAAEGAEVVVTGRRGDRLDAAVAAIADATGRRPLALQGDITAMDEPARVVAAAVEHFGRLDVLVPNAGGPPARRALDISDDDLASAVNANLTTTVRLVRAARPHLAAGGSGRICAITSASVLKPMPSLALSNTARTGLWAWARTAALELRDEGTTLNLVCPGPHRTDRAVQLGIDGPMGEPVDFGKAVAWLCSAAARFITGTTLLIDGGLTPDV